MAGALLDDIIRNMPVRILVVKLVNQEMFGTYPLLFEVNVMKTKMVLYRMSSTAMAIYCLLRGQGVTRYYAYLI